MISSKIFNGVEIADKYILKSFRIILYLVNDEKLEEDFEYSLSTVGDLGEQKD